MQWGHEKDLVYAVMWKRKESLRPEFIIDNELIVNRKKIANEFNKYFVSFSCL